MSDMTEATKDKLIADFKVVVADTEELLKLTAGQAGDKVAEVRGRLSEHLAGAKTRLADLEVAVLERTKKVARATDDYVHEHPWQSVGAVAGIAFLFGLLIGRR